MKSLLRVLLMTGFVMTGCKDGPDLGTRQAAEAICPIQNGLHVCPNVIDGQPDVCVSINHDMHCGAGCMNCLAQGKKCMNGGCEMPPPDMVAVSDMTMPSDLMLLPDMATASDMALLPDMAFLSDMTLPADMAVQPDIMSMPDIAPVTDMAVVMNDMAVMPSDLAPMPDMGIQPPDMSGFITCPTFFAPCFGICVDIRVDNTNCNNCGVTCGGGTACALTSNGSAQCLVAADGSTPTDLGTTDAVPSCNTASMCGMSQVNTCTDNNNCGDCQFVCRNNSTCQNGECRCTSLQAYCTTTTDAGAVSNCTNIQTDSANCGACGVVCPMGRPCNNWMCGEAN